MVVGQSERCASAESVRPLRPSSSLGLGFVVRFWLTLAMGVGHHFRAQESSESVPRVAYSSRPSPGFPLLLVPDLAADSVGYSPRDQEDPRSAVRGPDILCRNWDR